MHRTKTKLLAFNQEWYYTYLENPDLPVDIEMEALLLLKTKIFTTESYGDFFIAELVAHFYQEIASVGYSQALDNISTILEEGKKQILEEYEIKERFYNKELYFYGREPIDITPEEALHNVTLLIIEIGTTLWNLYQGFEKDYTREEKRHLKYKTKKLEK